MKTIVWVLMAYTYGSNYVPTLEFTTEAKCIKASKDVNAAIDSRRVLLKSAEPFCISIEK